MQDLRVLIIDNSIIFHEDFAAAITPRLPRGSLVEKVQKIEETAEKLRLFRPTIIVMNFALASAFMQDEKFMPWLKQHVPDIPIVTYGMMDSSKNTARRLGAAAYIKRPLAGQSMAPFYDAIMSTLLVLQAQYDYKNSPSKIIGGGAVVTREIWSIGHKTDAPAEKRTAESTLPFYKSSVSHINLIAMGASTGGTEALSIVLKKLQPPLPGIVIVQHIPPMFSKLFADRLNTECSLTVKEAASGDVVMPNHVYIAPGGKHMTVQSMGSRYMLECKPGPPVHSVCPSVDVLFDSVAEIAGDKALGVILTGMGRDGADGLLHMRQKGSHTLGQDAATCTVYGMPKAAYEDGAVERQLPLTSIPLEIVKIVN